MLNTNEPIWEYINPSHINYEHEKRFALEYARTELTYKQLKNETLKYLKNNNSDKNINILNKLDDSNFNIVGKYAWILNNNGILSEDSKKFFNDKLNQLFKKQKSYDYKRSKISASKRKESEGFQLFQSLEDLILEDQFNFESENYDKEASDLIYDHLSNKNPNPSAIQNATKHVQSLISEIKNSDDEHRESYGDYKNLLHILSLIKNELKTYKTNSKLKRKTEKEKSSARGKQARKLKATQNLKYKKEEPNLKLVSINPMSIIGANTLMTYNTKTRKISIFYSQDSNGLNLRGTTIHNYDTEKSFQKILRDPKKQIEALRNVSLKRVEIVLNENIKGKKQKVSGRINEHIVLMAQW